MTSTKILRQMLTTASQLEFSKSKKRNSSLEALGKKQLSKLRKRLRANSWLKLWKKQRVKMSQRVTPQKIPGTKWKLSVQSLAKSKGMFVELNLGICFP